MGAFRKYLVIDDDSHNRFLVSKTLLRQFPDALVQECQDANTAIELIRGLPPEGHETVVIAHSTPQLKGAGLVSTLRAAHSSVPIVWMGEAGQAHWAQHAGATQFLDHMAWLMIGQTAKELNSAGGTEATG